MTMQVCKECWQPSSQEKKAKPFNVNPKANLGCNSKAKPNFAKSKAKTEENFKTKCYIPLIYSTSYLIDDC